MVKSILEKIFGSENDRALKKITPCVSRVNAFEPSSRISATTSCGSKRPSSAKRSTALAATVRPPAEEGARISPLDEAINDMLDDLLPEAFAVVREMSRRKTDMRHFDVQLIGGAALHGGQIAEMKTGEGKTLVATLPAYLNALSGRGVHIVTVNDYLAKRDTEWMAPSTGPWGFPWARSITTCPTPSARPPTGPTSPMERTTSSASTTCAIT